MSLEIGIGRSVQLNLATPADRRTDEAMAAQNQAAEVQSEGMERPPAAGIDRLLAQPDGLARFR